MKVLVACEYSGRVRDAFLAKGHDAMSCDLLPTESPGPHYEGNVFDIIGDGWDLMVAHPPCTYLSNSGVSWLYRKPGRWDQMRDGAEFFRDLLRADEIEGIPKIAVENPIMHKYAVEIIGGRQDQIVQPWMFGHPESKATCLWLKGLPELVETDNVKDDLDKLSSYERQRIYMLSPSAERQKMRSLTYQGIADAMADQWG